MNKVIFRVLGALASALIIVSVFVPFINMSGYTENLWHSYQTLNSLYLPIMIIVFGAIGVIFFSLNIKTEFAYMTTGAILFFAIMQTITFIDQNSFGSLSIGYYFMLVGSIFTGIMAFLCNLKVKNSNQDAPVQEVENNNSVLNQIDKLYNEQQVPQDNVIQPINNVVEPTSIEPVVPNVEQVEKIKPIEVVQPIQPLTQNQSVKEEIKPIPDVLNQQVPVQNNTVVPETPVISEVTPIPVVEPQIEVQPVNPVIGQFSQPNPQPVQQSAQNLNVPNPGFNTVNNFNSQPVNSNVIKPQPNFENIETSNVNQPVNPVIQDFMNPGNLNQNTTTNNSSTDIFGQPINK